MEMSFWLGGENDGNVIMMVVVVVAMEGKQYKFGDCGGGGKSIKMW